MAAEHVERFCEGLDLADEIIRRLEIRDPLILRSAAEAAEQRASSAFEAGVAAGYRIAAAELEDQAEKAPQAPADSPQSDFQGEPAHSPEPASERGSCSRLWG